MALFRRRPAGPATDAPPAAGAGAVGDSPESLRAAMISLNRFVNSSAGKLPADAVVASRRITDVVAEVLDTTEVRPLDVYAVISVKGILTDYLPTTVRSFLAVDEALVDQPRPSGRTPVQSLREQLDSLETAATTVLTAVQGQDADTLLTQGNFLRTKFSGSDLDL